MKKKQNKNWMQSAVKHPGALRSTLHEKAGKDIAISKLKAAASKPGIEGRRARLALVFKRSR